MGAGGAGMSGLARLLRHAGWRVTGSDVRAGPELAALQAEGFGVHVGHDPAALDGDVDLVIRSAAVPPEDPELAAASARGLVPRTYGQALGELVTARKGVAVAGAHGKTGTAALLLHALDALGRGPGGLAGGRPLGRPHAAWTGDGPFVAEACEYRGNFLEMQPGAAILTDADWDHPDCYPGPAEAMQAFMSFVETVQGPVVADAGTASGLGGGDRFVVAGADVVVERAGHRLLRLRAGDFRAAAHHPLPVPHVLKQMTLVATLLIHVHGEPPEYVLAALASFPGVARRFQRVDAGGSVAVIDDYAHHPREIEAVAAAAREAFPGRRLLAVFQPHHTARTTAFLDGFARALAGFERSLVVATYRVPGREGEEGPAAGELAARVEQDGGRSRCVEDPAAVPLWVAREARKGDVVILMGAGDLAEVVEDVVRALR